MLVGGYPGRRPNLAADIARELAGAADLEVVQAWIALGQVSADPLLRSLTTSTVTQRIPKFTLLQGVDLSSFNFLLVSDDDVVLPADFGVQPARRCLRTAAAVQRGQPDRLGLRPCLAQADGAGRSGDGGSSTARRSITAWGRRATPAALRPNWP